MLYRLAAGIIAFSLLCLTCGCAFVVSDHFSNPAAPAPGKGYLLRGSGWKDTIYGYTLNNAVQVETAELIAAAQIENHYQRIWMMGPFLPVIPTLGLVKSGYDGKSSHAETGVKVNMAFYLKTEGHARIDPCSIVVGTKGRHLLPTRFSTSFQASKYTSACGHPGAPSEVRLPGRASDIFLVQLFYPEAIYPDDIVSVHLPEMEANGRSLHGASFRFTKGTDAYLQVIL